jgi:ankyrin repeat protein/choline dehydrogenase-like flavoprotein
MPDIEALVIGSGFGGAVAALRLGQARVDTIVLERGRRWPILDPRSNATFATFERPDGRSEWLNSVTKTPAYEGHAIDRYTGILELLQIGGYTFMTGAGVGGGSLVYGGILIQPTERLFQEIFPASIDYGEMNAVYYPRVRSVIHTEPIPDDVLDSDYYTGLRVLRDHAVKAGFPERPWCENPDHDCTVRFPMAVDWDAVRGEMNGTKVRSVIGAEFWYGNNSGAKQTLDRDYLRLAEETGHVAIQPLHEVRAIRALTDGRYRVDYDIRIETGTVVETGQLTCRSLFMAAGTISTNRLLIRAKARGDLPHLHDDLGSNVGNDGDTFVYRTGLAEVTNPHLGGPGAIAVLNYDNPIAPCLMMRGPLPRFEQDFPARNAIGTFVFAQTGHRGRFRYDPPTDAVNLDYPPDPVAQSASAALAERLSKACGGDVSPVSFNVTGHQVGGAPMGNVCDEVGRALGHPGLYVIDGALIPGSTTPTNPAFTIAAIAERSIERIIATDIRPSFRPSLPAGVPMSGSVPASQSNAGPATLPTAHEVARRYFDALGRGDIPGAMACLADDVEWINLPKIAGVSDIVPWLGTRHGVADVADSFRIRDAVVKVKRFEPVDLVVDGNLAVGTIHDQATVLSTELDFDIVFASWMTIEGGKITHWKSYADPSPIIAAFRGDGSHRLLAAVAAEDNAAVAAALGAGADPDARDARTGLTALMMAACRGLPHLVKLLLDAGADPFTTDSKTGATALHKACQSGNIAVARLLLDHGSFVDAICPTTGHTPLMEALWYKWPDLVAYLIERGQNLNLATHYGFTLDDHISFELNVNQGEQKQKYVRIKDLVAKGRADAAAEIARQGVMDAVRKKDRPRLEQLIAGGHDVNTVYPHVDSFFDGHTPLLVAARDARSDVPPGSTLGTDIVATLLKAGAKVRVEDWVFKGSPIHKATYNGNPEVLKLLLADPTIDVDVQGPINGYTPLHDALWHGFEECSRLLVDAGARLDLVGHDGKTVLDLATEVLGADNALTQRIRKAARPA